MVTKTVDDLSDGNHWPNITSSTPIPALTRLAEGDTLSLAPQSYLIGRGIQSTGENA